MTPAPDEPIAIIGIACRFPGAADADAFWTLLETGGDAITEVPVARRRLSPGPWPPWGGFLPDIDRFDAGFFRIAPREAAVVDPQQRLVLEVACDALDDAGVPIEGLAGSPTGVYVGICNNDYAMLCAGAAEPPGVHAALGNAHSIAANRLSYVLGLHGPSLAVDTACSSSLVAVQLACESLRRGTCEMALAGGVNVLLRPEVTIAMSRDGLMASDGRCKTFSAEADGYVRSEGVGVVVLKPLARARADGDRVRAVIRGGAVNNDGPSNGLIAPNRHAQEALLARACRDAGISPSALHYVEAHGSGTAIGDAIEARALGAVVGAGRAAEDRCLVGSVKSNVGHLESAAGIAGLIKVVLALEHRHVPATLHCRTPNPRIAFSGMGLEVVREGRPWPSSPGRAAVSSFGFGGTNAAVIVEEAPADPAEPCPVPVDGPFVLPLSARDPEALRALAETWRDRLRADDPTPIADLCFSASVRRSQHSHRYAVVGQTKRELADGLAEALATPRRTSGHGQRPRLAFVFPGQGSQWLGMGRRLLETEPVLRVLEQCEAAFRRHVSWSLLGELEADELGSHLDRVDVVQPVIFALQVAMAALWREYGVVPDAVIGHSLGEVAAAHVAGALDLETAARIICRRSQVVRRTSGGGGMAVVALPPGSAEEAIGEYADVVGVAAHNSPESCVLSGDRAALETIVGRLGAVGVFARLVNVDYASHGPQMDPLLPELRRLLGDIVPDAGAIPIYSSVTGGVVPGTALDAAYWGRNLRERVSFADAVQALVRDGHTAFVEVSPHPVLTAAVSQCLGDRVDRSLVLASGRKATDERITIQTALARLYVAGWPVRWKGAWPARRHAGALPSYPWVRHAHWVGRTDTRHAAGAHRAAPSLVADPVLGRRVWGALPIFATTLGALAEAGAARAVEAGHLMPPRTYTDLMHAAMRQVVVGAPVALHDLAFEAPLRLEGEADRVLQTVVSRRGRDVWGVEVFAAPHDGNGGERPWSLLATAVARIGAATSKAVIDLAAVRARLPEPVADADAVPAAAGIRRVRRRRREALAQLTGRTGMDGCTETIDVVGTASEVVALAAGATDPHLARACRRLSVLGDAREAAWCYARVTATAAERRRGTAWLLDASGRTIAEARGLEVEPLGGADEDALQSEQIGGWLYEPAWEARELRSHRERANAAEGEWIVVGDAAGFAGKLVDGLEAHGGRCVVVDGGDPGVLIERALARGRCRGIVHCSSLDAGTPTDATGRWAAAESALPLLRAIAGVSGTGARVWFVTRAAQAAGGTTPEPALAALWGLGRVAALEHPDAWGGLVDLDPAAPADEARLVVDELLAGDVEDQVAFRSGTRLVLRLVRTPTTRTDPPRFDPDAVYLITGGFGALGLAVADWIVAAGGRHVALVSRHGMPDAEEPPGATAASVDAGQRREAIAALERRGARIFPFAADAADRDAMADVVRRLTRDGRRLAGVVHAAGVLALEPVRFLTSQTLAEVLRPKADGAQVLHDVTAELPLDFFVMFASAAGVCGGLGLGPYAAASHFLDALAHARRASGRPALSIDWGAWAGAGMAAGTAREVLSRNGMAPMSRAIATRALAHAVAADLTQVMIADVDWAVYHPAYVARRERPLLERLAPHRAAPIGDAGPLAALRARLVGLSGGAQADILLEHITSELRTVLGIPTSQPVEPDVGFFAMGLDSIMSLELKNRLEQLVGRRLPSTIAFDHPTPWDLARFLPSMLDGGSSSDDAAAVAPADDDAGQVQAVREMSTVEVEATLEAELAALEP